jgi:hypothetical protein
VSETTGPSPGFSVCTWVSVTLKGAVTFTLGAAASVDPVTSTLPVAPGSVHSGTPPSAGAAVGHPASLAVSVRLGGVNTSEEVLADDELADESSVSDPHAASVTTRDAAQAAMATEEDPREKFTVATVQPR